MALLPADELVQFTFIEKITETTTQNPPNNPPTTQTIGQLPNQTTFTMPGTPGVPVTNTTTTEVQVTGYLYIRQIVAVTMHINDAGNPQPGRSDVTLTDGTKRLVAASVGSIINDITV